ncbi:ABC transporter substrate-binding protein [Paenibacillus physcomitrellae]|uniref:ABC transporter substrate-binding protein n=1 Tax=Paenibacillus physcomitrellae TaxID=1619311 RepID=A0ABQ1GQJ1_9BACL|nr:ABC transporter substrate-binding protein [Paenibacillus physcomitrellae]GGA47704.1 ABC transporter substrate-binding protein [Paenibacillus physcomitrellae]
MPFKHLKKAFQLTAVASLVSLLAACSGGTSGGPAAAQADAAANSGSGSSVSPEGRVVLDYWTWWGSETRRPIIEKLVDDFNKSQDKIFVKHSYYPYSDIFTKELAAVSAGNPPDIMMNDINTVQQRASKNQAMNLSKYVERDKVQDRFFPELWNTVLYNGEPYALPFNTDTRMMFYNKDDFKEAGLDPDKFPDTWDELEQAAQKLDKKHGNTYTRIGYSPQFNSDWNLLQLNFDGGRNFFDESGKPVVNAPAKAEALQYILDNAKRLGQKNIDAFKADFGSQQANPFLSGRVSIWTDVTNFYTQIRDYGDGINFGVAPLPETKEGAGHWSVGGGFVIEIPYGAKHPDEAWEFLKYMTDVEAQTYWAEKNFDNVANKEASNSSELMSNPVYKASVENLAHTKLTPNPLNAPDYMNLINPQRDAIMLGQTSIQDGLNKAQADVEKLVSGK